MKRLLTGSAAIALVLGLSVTAANASPVLTSFGDVGFGNLSGYNPFNILDNQTAGLTVNVAKSDAGLVTTNIVAESLNGHSFTLTPRGNQIGNSNTYLAGFTFNLGTASYLQYVPSSPGESWIFTKGAPTLSGGIVTPGAQIGGDNASHFANLDAGKYTLLFRGVVDLALGGSTSFGGTISTVPLPGSLLMFGSALVGLTAFSRRRRPAMLAS